MKESSLRRLSPLQRPFFFCKGGVFVLAFSFLTHSFYEDYKDCPEIERKETRPYIRITIEVDGVLFGIPMRSNINHPHVLWTNKKKHCGVDFSKAVVITDPEKYINTKESPYIRPDEFKELKGKDRVVQDKMRGYIEKYKEAKKRMDIPRNRTLVSCSTLQYFEDYI